MAPLHATTNRLSVLYSPALTLTFFNMARPAEGSILLARLSDCKHRARYVHLLAVLYNHECEAG